MTALPAAIGLADLALMRLSALLPTEVRPETAYLTSLRQQAGEDPQQWHRLVQLRLDTPIQADRPLVALRAPLGLSDTEVLAAALSLRVELDVRAARSMAFVQQPIGGSRPTLGLIAEVLAPPEDPTPIPTLMAGAAIESGLLQIEAQDLPLVERTIRMPHHLITALAGRTTVKEGCRILLDHEHVPLPASVHEAAQQHARSLSQGRALVLRSGAVREARSVAALVAKQLGRRAVFITTDRVPGVVPWLGAAELVPVFERILAPSERWTIAQLPRYQGPMLAITSHDGTVDFDFGRATTWRVPVPAPDERATLWCDSGIPKDVCADVAHIHRHGSARIHEVAQVARQLADTAARPVTSKDVAVAARQSNAAGIDGLAQPVIDAVPRSAMVLSERLQKELSLVQARCRGREGLIENLGDAATTRYRPGVRSLFVGPSGTGKTLAVSWISGELGVPLYRVDLASVVSKYIGETEKNLAQLLALAEHADVALLFDEADSLFGKRTDVKHSNDRFANAQTNYLLQRMESFEGIAFLTSNSRSRFDSAFTRRLDFIIEFNTPSPEERRILWTSHLGAHHALTAKQINQLAATVDLAGGHIRNIVLTAATTARMIGRPIEWSDILTGIEHEFRKLGRQVPPGLRPNAHQPR
ncbi:MAG: ATP-binding protein [Myxococcota bacterium]